MRHVRPGFVAVGFVASVLAGNAFADGDNRGQDRFYFGAHAGVASYSTSIGDMVSLDDPASAFGLETSCWPNDYVGFGWGYDAASLTTTTAGLGAYAVAAVPLRYVQPYAGGWIGLRFRAIGDASDTQLLIHPIVGLNGYVNRNTRLFVQLQQVRLDADMELDAKVATVGVRWSPDMFHRLRGADKFSVLWLATLVSVASFAITRRTVGGTWL